MSVPGPLPPRPPIRFLILAVLGCLDVVIWGLKTLIDSPSTLSIFALVLWAATASLALRRWRKDVQQFKSTH
jgi:hypothetical protein